MERTLRRPGAVARLIAWTLTMASMVVATTPVYAQTLAPTVAQDITATADLPALSPPSPPTSQPTLLEQLATAPFRAQLSAPTDQRIEFVSRRSEFDRPLIADVAKRLVLDPTTYAPAAIVYTSLHLDWKSSQPMFRAGYNEAHSGYTRSGLANDIPVGYAEGQRRNLNLALRLLGRSAANNAISAVVERALIERAPRHRKLIRILGWIERTAFASYFSYVLSEQHFEQWRKNEAMARQIGAR
jgi:hypothetical protein